MRHRFLGLAVVVAALCGGCTADAPAASAATPTVSTLAATAQPEPGAEKYRVSVGSIAMTSATGSSADIVVHSLYQGMLQPDGTLVNADSEGLFPNSGGIWYDETHKNLQRMRSEKKSLTHDGSVVIMLRGGILSYGNYCIYDSDFQPLKEFQQSGTRPIGREATVQLPKAEGIYYLCIVAQWLAPEQFSEQSGKEYEGYEYVAMVQYKETAGPT